MEAIAAGATGFVQKYSGSDELVDTLRQVAEGRLMIPDDAVRRVFRLLRGGTVLMPGPKVTGPLKGKDMPIPESTLSKWSHHQAGTAFKEAHVPIREALDVYKWP